MTAVGAPDPSGSSRQLLARRGVVDDRGVLTPYVFDELPFLPVRMFTVTQVPEGAVRGGHAHRTGHQLLSCVSGAIEVILRTDRSSSICLLTPGSGDLHVKPGTWSSQRYLTAGSALLVLCSEAFEPASYMADPAPSSAPR